MADESGEKKIIIDEDWKTQVEAEKAAQEEEKKSTETKAAEEPAQAPESDPAAGKMPEASFSMLLTTLASEAMVSLGQFPHPATGESTVNLDQARYFIDTLGILEEKTKGNLSDEEGPMLESILHQLRMVFVAAQNAPPAQGGGS